MGSRHFDLDGLHVRQAPARGEAGDSRPPLLLVHGAGHGAWCWDNWMDVLPSRGWQSFALSLRGHPGSAPVDEETYCTRLTVSDYAEDVRKVARHIARPCVVIGHSMGGMAVQQYIAEETGNGDAEAAAILLASAPPGQLGPIRNAALPTGEPYVLDAQTIRERYFFSRDEAVWTPAVDQMVGESPSVVNQYSLGAGVPISPADLPCPVLVVSAERDASAAPSDGRIAEYLGVDYILAEGIGHDMMLDAGWERVLEQVLAWLAARFPAA